MRSVEKRPDKWYVVLGHLENLPYKTIRFTLRGEKQQALSLNPGDRIIATVMLMSPPAPPTPEVYNFRQKAYFMELNAVGYALKPPQRINALEITFAQRLQDLRHSITQKLQAGVKGQEGAIAAALVTGDRAGISPETRQAFADAGIAHILAISGLHLAIVAGFVFFFIRRGLGLIASISLRYSTKKIAAFITLLITTFYLMLCWQSLPARRAYLMTSLIMLAILVDRSALSLRNVMFAATLILLFLPESLLSPSFQLSFSAVIALIAGYESFQPYFNKWQGEGKYSKKISRYVMSVLGTTTIATLATTPFTLYTFNQCTLHSLWSNLAAIPLTTFWIMPLEFVSVLALPLGLEPYIFSLLRPGLTLLKEIAFEVSAWPYATLYIPKSSLGALLAIIGGGLWICLWQRQWRWLGIAPLMIGFFFLFNPSTADIYIDSDRTLVGLREENALYLTSLRASKFTAHLWQKHAGNLPLKHLNDHPAFRCAKGHCRGMFKGKPLEILLANSLQPLKCHSKTTLINLKNNLKCADFSLNITKKQLIKHKGMLIKGDKIYTVSQFCGKRAWS